MNFRKARDGEQSAVAGLYRSVIGQAGCSWNEYYPGEIELCEDFTTENIYVLTLNEAVIGAVSVVHTNELDHLDCWHRKDGTQKELARVVIAAEHQGHGYAYEMMTRMLSVLRADGCGAVHLLVNSKNVSAQRLYRKFGFLPRGECDMYGHHYYACELILEE